MELHTFSSLNTNFLDQYKGCMNQADVAVIFYNDHALSLKKLPPINSQMVIDNFGRKDIKVFNDRDEMVAFINSKMEKNTNLLMMSSGDFDGLDLKALSVEIMDLLN
jgi:UDP-N-acetylmuramate: L-alanyl-gamma-D-glutamyl-meso-diaminopimelate ligase